MMSAPFSYMYSATVQVAVAVYQAQVPVLGYKLITCMYKLLLLKD